MRTAFVVYGLLYVAVEVVSNKIDQVGWPQLTALDVATACSQAALAVAVVIALLVGWDLAVHRWRRHRRDRARVELAAWAEPAPLTVESVRVESVQVQSVRVESVRGRSLRRRPAPVDQSLGEFLRS
jgi:predicted transporter